MTNYFTLTTLALGLSVPSWGQDIFKNLKIDNEKNWNTQGQEFNPSLCKNQLFFVSSYLDKANKAITQIKTVTITTENISDSAQIFNDPELNSKGFDKQLIFDPTGSKAYLTRSNDKTIRPLPTQDRKMKLKVYSALKKDEKQWKAVKNAIPVDDDDFSTGFMAFSPDGNRMYLSSNRPGGQGGFDLYVCVRQADGWSTPANLGAKINSAADEISPFLATDGTLYFASNRQGSMGGFDVFFAQRANQQWTNPKNLPIGINGTGDDFGLVLTQDLKIAYFTSNRVGGQGGEDIYSARAANTFKMEAVVEGENDETIEKGENRVEVRTINQQQYEQPTTTYQATNQQPKQEQSQQQIIVIETQPTTAIAANAYYADVPKSNNLPLAATQNKTAINSKKVVQKEADNFGEESRFSENTNHTTNTKKNYNEPITTNTERSYPTSTPVEQPINVENAAVGTVVYDNPNWNSHTENNHVGNNNYSTTDYSNNQYLYASSVNSGSNNDTEIYLVSVGAFSDPKNAQAMLQKVKSFGFVDAEIVRNSRNLQIVTVKKIIGNRSEAQAVADYINSSLDFQAIVKTLNE